VEGLKTEEEQVEAIRQWIRDNGKSVLVGVALGLAAVFGWRQWAGYRQSQAAQASSGFERMVAAAASDQTLQARELGERVLHDYGGTAYGFFSALTLSSLDLDKGDLSAAQARLEWAQQHLPDKSLEPVVRLRLAAVLLARGEGKKALVLVDRPVPGAFAARRQEIKGDIEMALGDRREARTAYAAALAAADAADRSRIQMKLDDVPEGSSP
jgi:predicted negative regulator of RcsB-dependent stress response